MVTDLLGNEILTGDKIKMVSLDEFHNCQTFEDGIVTSVTTGSHFDTDIWVIYPSTNEEGGFIASLKTSDKVPRTGAEVISISALERKGLTITCNPGPTRDMFGHIMIEGDTVRFIARYARTHRGLDTGTLIEIDGDTAILRSSTGKRRTSVPICEIISTSALERAERWIK